MRLADLREYIESYAFNPEREELASYLGNAIDSILEHTEIERVTLYGSYFTPKGLPNDIDIIIQTKEYLPEKWILDGIGIPDRDADCIHLLIMSGRLFDAFSDWASGETVVIE